MLLFISSLSSFEIVSNSMIERMNELMTISCLVVLCCLCCVARAVGWLMFLTTAILAILSRYYERALLATEGLGTIDEYFQYLRSCDKTLHEPKRGKVFDVSDIKVSIYIYLCNSDMHIYPCNFCYKITS